MKSTLLATQLNIPQPSSQTIARGRLVSLVERGLPAVRLALVSAPAGYGKTTLLAQWARSSSFRVAWVSCTPAENDPERFWRYLYRAWERVQPEIRESELGLMLEGPLVDLQPVLVAFINLAQAAGEPLAFVLDDVHLVDNPEVHQALAYLLDHLPGQVHFILATRADPDLPLARYRARGELLELRLDDLKFSLEETERFFRQSLEGGLSQADLAQLQTDVEGWAAGLRMVGLSIARRPGEPSTLRASGKQRYIADYLRQDVFDQRSEAEREFLLQTSILDSLSASLCNAVTGRPDSQAALEMLERANLFMVPLDDRREWYRYHALFGDFLRAELARRSPGQVLDLHRRAASWYLAHDFAEQAYRHALAAGDLDQVVALFNRYTNAKLQGGEFKDIKRWLEGLPPAWFDAHPALMLAWAGYFAFTGAFERCLRLIDQVEDRLAPLQDQDERRQMARVKSVRCFIACIGNDLPKAEAYAEQAMRELPAEDEGYLPNIYIALGDTYRQNGLWDRSQASYLKALEYAHAPVVQVSIAHIYGAIADLYTLQGRLRLAAQYWQKALAAIQERENWGRIPLPVTGWIHVRTAGLLFERNELDAAAQHLSQGLERAEMGGDIRTQIAGNILNVHLALARGDLPRANEALLKAAPALQQAHFPDWVGPFERCQVEVWLAENRLRDALAWYGEAGKNGAFTDGPERDTSRLAAARVLVAAGSPQSVGQALALLDDVFTAAERSGRGRAAIEALALLALARWQVNDLPGALTAIERALREAEPEGYLRLFVDLGLPMARLLQEARSRDIAPVYVEKILDAMQVNYSRLDESGPGLPEPLTPREQEILGFIAAGLSNREIATRLVISPETVKKHAGSILHKLGVSNRTEAAARARTLGLLEE